MVLNKLFYHDRDARIQFFNDGHIYKIDDDCSYKSVTTFVKKFFNPFDANTILMKMKRNGTFSKKYGTKTIEQVKNEWNDTGKHAAELGTLLHICIENFYNQISCDIPKSIETEFDYFKRFHKEHVISNGLEPYRTEWYIFMEEYKIAGSVDMVFKLRNGNLAIYDWKRSKKIEFSNKYSKALNPISHLDDCNMSHYSLQLNLYRYILEKKYDKVVEKLCLVFLHHDNSSYIIIEVKDQRNDIENMLTSFITKNELVS